MILTLAASPGRSRRLAWLENPHGQCRTRPLGNCPEHVGGPHSAPRRSALWHPRPVVAVDAHDAAAAIPRFGSTHGMPWAKVCPRRFGGPQALSAGSRQRTLHKTRLDSGWRVIRLDWEN